MDAYDYEIFLPTFHEGQKKAWDGRGRFTALRAGRRMGKTAMMQAIACRKVAEGKNVGWFAPSFKLLSEAYTEISEMIAPLISGQSRTQGIIRTKTGGRIDFWSLENERAGRSRKYHVVMLDEVAFAKNSNMMKIWDTAIKPTLLDYVGECWAGSTPNGIDPDNFFWRICNEPEHEFVDFHAPSAINPYLPATELEKLRITSHPLVYKQEYLAEFIDWGGQAFFGIDKLMVDNKPVPYPERCDYVYAVMDTAIKGGQEHDGTAIIYFTYDDFAEKGYKITILDYDVIQVDGALLESWMPSQFELVNKYHKQCGGRYDPMGIWIEDASTGSILLQQGGNKGWNTNKIDSRLTSVGKDERAISVSSYFEQGMIKISQHAYDKLVNFKGASRNHLLSQVTTFRIGDKDAHSRADDLLDCMVYGLAITCGNREGF